MPKILAPSMKTTKRRTRRRRTMTTTRRSRGRTYGINSRRAHGKSFNNNGGGDYSRSKDVSDKLQALKNLIPAQKDNGAIKAEMLFQETAEYILLLRTQVVILQSLIEFHGSGEMDQEEQALL